MNGYEHSDTQSDQHVKLIRCIVKCTAENFVDWASSSIYVTIHKRGLYFSMCNFVLVLDIGNTITW